MLFDVYGERMYYEMIKVVLALGIIDFGLAVLINTILSILNTYIKIKLNMEY